MHEQLSACYRYDGSKSFSAQPALALVVTRIALQQPLDQIIENLARINVVNLSRFCHAPQLAQYCASFLSSALMISFQFVVVALPVFAGRFTQNE